MNVNGNGKRTFALATGCFLLLATTALSQADRPLELEDYYRIESADEPALSPDGRFVAFTRERIDEEENTRRREVWLVATDGSRPARRLTSPAFDSDSPRFSPEGTLLAFNSERDGGSVWFLDLEAGGEAFQIPGADGLPTFSHDGQWMAFTKKTPPQAERPVPTALERKLDERFTGKAYDWMQFRYDRRGYLPDPTDPYESPPRELYVVPRAGGEPRRLTALGVDVVDFAWAPDGSELVVAADAHQRDEYVYPRKDLWRVSLQGATTRLTDDGFDHSAPTYSPDGSRLAFRRVRGLSMVIEEQAHQGAPVDVFVMNVDGTQTRNVTRDWELRPGAPRFAPDGQSLYFAAAVSGNNHLFRADASSGTVEQVTTGARRLSDFSFSDGFDTVAFVVAAPDQPAEIGFTRLDGSQQRALTALNGWLDDVALSAPERLLYPSDDGTEIEGWYLPPASGTPEPHALILAIHGGPHGAYGNQFMFEFQLWAAAGYGVVYTNPRGSLGYGEEFLYGTWGGWGLKDTEDVLAGVDHVLARHPVDPARTGVTGYSYGGFLTNWILGQTTRFTAAISGAGISNWISDYATADIPRTKESEFYGPPWQEESGALLRRLSPITYAAKMRTPTLFIHGESDMRVPVEQAEQMYVSLKKQKVPAKMIRYPDSYHGGWAPWDMVHRYYHGLKWWDRYLGSRAPSSQEPEP